MTLPETISIHAVGSPGTDLSDIIFELGVTSGNKNRYYILFPKTDENGLTQLSSDEFRGQFEDHWESGLMDYNGTVETALPTVTVQLLDKGRIEQNLDLLRAWPLLKNEQKWWGSREEKLQCLLSCRNDKVSIPATSWQVDKASQIEVTVQSKV